MMVVLMQFCIQIHNATPSTQQHDVVFISALWRRKFFYRCHRFSKKICQLREEEGTETPLHGSGRFEWPKAIAFTFLRSFVYAIINQLRYQSLLDKYT